MSAGEGALAARRERTHGLDLASTGRWARTRARGLLGRAALLGLVALSLALVLLAASRPSFLTPTSASGYFPTWMAGPLSGLWPRASISEHTLRVLVSAILAAMYLAYLASLACSARLSARWVIGAVLAVHLAFLLAPPLQYTDVFNYINYARMGTLHNLNPYATIPMLEPHTDPAFALSNWHWLQSPYGPLFTLASYVLVPLGITVYFWVFKAILCAASLAALALVWRCARLLRRDPVKAVAIAGLNPIVLMWGLGADHNDVLMVLPVVLGVYLLIRSRSAQDATRRLGARVRHEHLAGAAFVVAAGVKASAVVLIPVAFAAARERRAFALGVVASGAALVLLSFLCFGAHIPGVGVQTRLVTDVGPGNVLGWLLKQGGETDTLRTLLSLLAGVLVLVCAVLAARRGRDWIALAGLSLLAVWLTTSWFAPWYLVWLLPFAALAQRRRLTLALLGIGVYLLLAFGPEVTPLLHTLHLNPFSSRIGREHLAQNSSLVR